jgi:hypothetical protein
MPSRGVRRSRRIPKEITVLLIGSNLEGRAFSEETNTVNLSQHGATVVSRHKLASKQTVIIRCLDTKMEAEACIVRMIESHADAHTYCLAFLQSLTDSWGADVVALIDSENEASRSVFECVGR